MNRFTATIAMAVLAAAFAATADARSASPAGKCASTKQQATGVASLKRLGCHASAAKRGVAVDPGCLDAVSARLVASFSGAERESGCAVIGDAPLINARVGDLVDAVVTALAIPSGQQKCAAGKLVATGAKVAAKLKCSAKAAKAATAIDAACLQKAEARFDAAFARLDGKGSCPTTGDAAAIEAIVDDLVADAATLLSPNGTTTTTTSTTTSTTTTTICVHESQTFSFTGAIQDFVVPGCAVSVTVTANGAQGGTGGGRGARTVGSFAVTPGETLKVVVGEQGHAQVGGNAQNSSGGPGFCGGGGGGCGGIGGFGGGGGGDNLYGGGGGGGGYSGGAGGTDPTHGGGGGSFNAGVFQTNTAGLNAGHGSVTIAW